MSDRNDDQTPAAEYYDMARWHAHAAERELAASYPPEADKPEPGKRATAPQAVSLASLSLHTARAEAHTNLGHLYLALAINADEPAEFVPYYDEQPPEPPAFVSGTPI